MIEKLVVQFENLPVYAHKVDYIVYCKGCHTYNINNKKACYKCGHTQKMLSLDAIAEKTVKKNFLSRTVLILIIYAVLFLLSMNFSNIIWVSVYTLVGLILNTIIYMVFKESFCIEELEKHIIANEQKIKDDLRNRFEENKAKVAAGKYLEAYEELRYLGMLMDSEELRKNKLACLNTFRLRKDLPLELKEVLVENYNIYLVAYIYEVSKIKKELIDEATILYILKYKDEILKLKQGREIIAGVIGGALKSKMLLDRYAQVVYEYIDYLPKDRIIRLCKIKEGITDKVLLEQIIDQIKLKYGFDEALVKYF